MASSEPVSSYASNTPPYSNANPPPVDLEAPPLITYASKFPGSPDEQAYARQQANANAQTDLNQKHAGGRRRRSRRRRNRRRRRGSLKGGDPDDPPANHIVVPQTDTGVHIAGPQNANSSSLNGNQTLINGRAQAQYDSLVPAPVILGNQSGGRRRTRKRRKRRGKGSTLMKKKYYGRKKGKVIQIYGHKISKRIGRHRFFIKWKTTKKNLPGKTYYGKFYNTRKAAQQGLRAPKTRRRRTKRRRRTRRRRYRRTRGRRKGPRGPSEHISQEMPEA